MNAIGFGRVTHSPIAAHEVRRLAVCVALLSAAVLGYELALMRILLVASWHHFAFIVISIALLGFGASGTALTLLQRWLLRRPRGSLLVLTAAAAIAMPVCTQLAQWAPLQARIVPTMWQQQLGGWAAYWAALFVPFFLGASAIGLALMAARQHVPLIYAGNLLGSGLGALAATALMWAVPPQWLPSCIAAVALLALVYVPGIRLDARVAAVALSAAIAAGWLAIDPPRIQPDPYKYAAHLDDLIAQGSARRAAVAYGPRGLVEAYSADLFHELPFLSAGGAAPPPIDALVIDGHRAGSLLRVQTAEQAEAVDHTLMAVPYALLEARARVLLLGETGGHNIWLAKRQNAAAVHAVQPNGELLEMLRGPMRPAGGLVLDLPAVTVTRAHPRHFVESRRAGSAAEGGFDLIQLVAAEHATAAGGGLGGLAEDYLLTVEGLAACLRRLSPDGLVSVCRSIQNPPRDNLKLLATFTEALQRIGMPDPSRHIVIVRDYLGVCTMVRVRAWTDAEIEQVRRLCDQRQLTPVWFTGIRPDELNRPDQLPGPPDGPGDWYHHTAAQLFSDDADRFIDDWAFNIRPPTDDRPFFADFSRLGALDEMRAAYGDLWLTRIELAFLFVLGAAVLVGLSGAALTLLPLAVWVRGGPRTGRAATIGMFTAIGLGYLMLEMSWLSRLTHLIGDPLLAASVTLASFLIFSGCGSLTAERLRRGEGIIIPAAAAAIILIGAAEMLGFDRVLHWAGGMGAVQRSALSIGLIAPLAYAMGFMMPLGLRRLDRAAGPLVPWAWGVNGFASVLAGPLTVAVGMSWGYSIAIIIALALYALAAAAFARLPQAQTADAPESLHAVTA